VQVLEVPNLRTDFTLPIANIPGFKLGLPAPAAEDEDIQVRLVCVLLFLISLFSLLTGLVLIISVLTCSFCGHSYTYHRFSFLEHYSPTLSLLSFLVPEKCSTFCSFVISDCPDVRLLWNTINVF